MTPGSGPAEPVVRHYQALDRNDIEAANTAIHNDSPTGGELPEDTVEQARKTDYVIKEVEVLSESSDRAEVRIVFTGTNTETGTKRTNELRIEVRPAGDEWKMWKILSFETLETTQND
ncbi:MAG: hypothetical protein ABEH61_05270 [Haloarculaceae archaeon]